MTTKMRQYRLSALNASRQNAQLIALLGRCLPYMKTVSRNDVGGYSENDPHLYEEIKAALDAVEPVTNP